MKPPAWIGGVIAVALAATPPIAALAQDDPRDWPTYNHDVLGTRHNPGERSIGAGNAERLEEKWRFPTRASGHEIGAIHATPTVVNGYVYFGTATDPTFYKLAPDGTVRWTFRRPVPPDTGSRKPAPAGARFENSEDGIFSSALVTRDRVFFADIGGRLTALDRRTGKERWTVSARDSAFPGAHPSNLFFSSPILAEGKVIVAGGTLEQVTAAFPRQTCCTGRGFVAALDPSSGRVLWKYDVGPAPQTLDPPVHIKDAWGDHVFQSGPATSSVWSTPSYDAATRTLFFGTDVNTAPRRPTAGDSSLSTRESCAIIAIDERTGAERWVAQISPGDVWTNAMRSWDPATGRHKDQAIGDTPKLYTIPVDGTPTRVVGAGSKNGGFYVLRASDGRMIDHTPVYSGPPTDPLVPAPDPRTLALPGVIGGLQTGCATDGRTVYTNGIDAIRLGAEELMFLSAVPPTGGRVVALSGDTRTEHWRHERPRVDSLGGPPPFVPVYREVGDPVASGIAVANGVVYFTTVASGRLMALDAARGTVLADIGLGPVWCGPSVSRGRVYVGTGNTLLTPADYEGYFPKKNTGAVISFGLPGDDEVSRMGKGRE